LRRGELCGVKWEDIDLETGTVRITRSRVAVNGQPEEKEPKTKQSRRTLNLAPVVPYLRTLQKLQKEDTLKAFGAYADHEYLVAHQLGRRCHPEILSGWFENAVADCGGLPAHHASRAATPALKHAEGQGRCSDSRRLAVPRTLQRANHARHLRARVAGSGRTRRCCPRRAVLMMTSGDNVVTFGSCHRLSPTRLSL